MNRITMTYETAEAFRAAGIPVPEPAPMSDAEKAEIMAMRKATAAEWNRYWMRPPKQKPNQ